ncbi:MAG: SUF system NifU family Fe-S cluster assembly protein [Calditrichaceae bacterium]|nr:SUF system NifU family Fe-S cluster assembly protein [Calditrichia bacterium]NUQ41071.1 SUF system NifU family Fe-S cluster assembly protein [Calditrichaceae bacterium]
MEELKELYQQIILDHNKSPKNYGKMVNCTHASEGYNPLCGDRIKIYAKVENGVIEDIKFEGEGCAIAKASGSIMTALLKGKTVAEAQQLFEEFQHLITSDVRSNVDTEKLGKLAVFAGVREFPTRVKCAGLAWHTVKAAIEKKDEVVTTE